MMAAAMAGRSVLTSASANTPVQGFGSGGGVEFVTSDPSTAVPVGGVGTYAYLWAYVSGDAAIGIIDATSASTAFTKNMGIGSTSGIFKCTVTNNGVSVDTNNVTVNLDNT